MKLFPSSFFQYRSPEEVKYIMRFSQLCDHKSKQLFHSTLNTSCTCSLEAKTIAHFILYCPYYENERRILLASILDIQNNILDENEYKNFKSLPYRNFNHSETQNTDILNATVKFFLSSMRLEKNLY